MHGRIIIAFILCTSLIMQLPLVHASPTAQAFVEPVAATGLITIGAGAVIAGAGSAGVVTAPAAITVGAGVAAGGACELLIAGGLWLWDKIVDPPGIDVTKPSKPVQIDESNPTCSTKELDTTAALIEAAGDTLEKAVTAKENGKSGYVWAQARLFEFYVNEIDMKAIDELTKRVIQLANEYDVTISTDDIIKYQEKLRNEGFGENEMTVFTNFGLEEDDIEVIKTVTLALDPAEVMAFFHDERMLTVGNEFDSIRPIFLEKARELQAAGKPLPPLKQLAFGFTNEEIVCGEDLQLEFKIRDASAICVKPQTAVRLAELGFIMESMS